MYSKLKGDGVEISSIYSKFNEHALDFTKEGGKLSRNKPIKFEQEIYIDESLIVTGTNMISLNQIIIKIKDKDVQFQLKPYLMAKDKIQKQLDKKGAGLKLDVMMKIQEMPPKLDIEMVSCLGQKSKDNVDQALIGNKHRLDIRINKDDQISLKSLNLQILSIQNVKNSQLANVNLDDHMDNQMLQSIDMNASVLTTQTNATTESNLSQRRYTQVRQGFPPRISAQVSGLVNSVITVNRLRKGGTAAVSTGENVDPQMQNKIKNLFGTEEDVKSTDADDLGLHEPEVELDDYEVQYQFEGDPEPKYLDCPLQDPITFDQSMIDKIQQSTDKQVYLSLYLTFYQQSNQNIDLKFNYSFTQNHKRDLLIDTGDEKNQQLFEQAFEQKLQIQVIQPFDIEWALIRGADDDYLRTYE